MKWLYVTMNKNLNQLAWQTLFERHRILEEIEEIMKNNNLYNIDSESTYFRRASTVISWVDWIVNLIK